MCRLCVVYVSVYVLEQKTRKFLANRLTSHSVTLECGVMNNKLSPSKRAELAELAGISPQYLYQCLSGRRCMGSLLAARVEHVTNGAVTRKELRPNDWHLVWPELKDEAVHDE